MAHRVRIAGHDDAGLIGQLLYDFDRECDEPALVPAVLAERLEQLIRGGDTVVLLVGDGLAGADGMTGADRVTVAESLGFTKRVGGADGPVMYVYEREL
jgi:hypothetical protein